MTKRAISVLMALCILVGMIPASLAETNMAAPQTGDGITVERDEAANTTTITQSQPLQATPQDPKVLAEMPIGTLLADAGVPQVEDTTDYGGAEWHYVLDEAGYAIIVGCTAPDSTALRVPTEIDGHLVRRIAENAFAEAPVLTVLTIPGSVVEIAPSALGTRRRQITVKCYNGTAADEFARRYAVDKTSLSVLYFNRGVVDFTGSREGAYKRLTGVQVSFAPLEGSRLAVGDVFFLPDSEKGYRITALTATADGFVADTEEPQARDVIYRVKADLSSMREVRDGIVYGNGVTETRVQERLTGGGSLDLFSHELTVQYPAKDDDYNQTFQELVEAENKKFGQGTSLKFKATISASIKLTTTIEGKIDADLWSITLYEFNVSVSFSITVSAKVKGNIKLTIPVAVIPPASAFVISANISVAIEFSFSASITVSYSKEFTSGVRYDTRRKTMEPYSDDSSAKGISVSGELSIAFVAKVYLDVPIVGNIAEWSFKFGVRGKATKVLFTEDDQGSWEESNGCTALETVTVPDSWTLFPVSIFEGCSKLRTVNVPSKLQSVGSCAFSGCMSPVSLRLPDTVTGIGSSAFLNCQSLADFTLPAGLTSLREKALANCYALTSLTVPSGINILEPDVFNGMKALSSITLPDTLVRFNARCLANCTALESLTLPAKLAVMEANCLSASGLRTFTMPTSVTSIGQGIFKNCAQLSEVHLPDSWTVLPKYTFEGCTSLTEIKLPSALQELQDGVFKSAGLKTISLPAGVKTLTAHLFDGCALEQLVIPSTVTSIAMQCFMNCSSLQSVFIPSSVTGIGNWAFGYCSGLKEVWLLASVSDLPQHIFYTSIFGAQPSIKLYGLEGSAVQQYAVKYDSVIFIAYTGDAAAPSTATARAVTADGYEYELDEEDQATITAYETESTSRLVLPTSVDGHPVIGIARGALSGPFNYVTIPAGVAQIERGAFMNASQLKIFTLASGNEHFQVVNNCLYDRGNAEGVTWLCCPRGLTGSFTVAKGSVRVGSYALAQCDGLTAIALSDTVTQVEDFAFYNCSAVTKLTLTDITSFAVQGFAPAVFGLVADCAASQFAAAVQLNYNLYSLTLVLDGKTLFSRQMQAGSLLDSSDAPVDAFARFGGWYKDSGFKNAWDFSKDTMPAAAQTLYGRMTSDFTFTVSGGAVTITGYAGEMGVLTIPETLGGYPVTAIAAGALCSTDSKPLLEVTIPACVTIIGAGALLGVEGIICDRDSAAQKYAAAQGISVELRTYTLRFACEKGTPAAELTLSAGDAVTLPQTRWDNHYLCGWYLDSDYIYPWAEDAVMPAEDITLYALWSRQSGVEQTDELDWTYGTDSITITGCANAAYEPELPESING